jgi:periplasmic divalent cation tolerance protein
MQPVIVLTTVGEGYDARALASQLVEQRLAACVNIVADLYSVYRWQGRVEHGQEQLLVIKTVEERLFELKEALFERHPYEVPEFVVVPIEKIEGPYLEWLLASVGVD